MVSALVPLIELEPAVAVPSLPIESAGALVEMPPDGEVTDPPDAPPTDSVVPVVPRPELTVEEFPSVDPDVPDVALAPLDPRPLPLPEPMPLPLAAELPETPLEPVPPPEAAELPLTPEDCAIAGDAASITEAESARRKVRDITSLLSVDP